MTPAMRQSSTIEIEKREPVSTLTAIDVATLAADIYRAPSFRECLQHVGDREIRTLLLAELRTFGLRCVEEWNTGRSRIDVAAISDRLHGYEIKSPRDSLTRLRTQARDYADVFDTMTLITDVAHLAIAEPLIPSWWGVTVVIPTLVDDAWRVTLVPVRASCQNPQMQSTALLHLLWCRELRALLQRRNMPWRRLRSKRLMTSYLALNVPRGQLRADVCTLLAQRTEWRLK